MTPRQVPGKLIKLFLQGVLLLAPISVTIWLVVGTFRWVDNILPDLVYNIARLFKVDSSGLPIRIPGLGFIVFIGIALLVGYLSPSFIVSRVVDIAESLLELRNQLVRMLEEADNEPDPGHQIRLFHDQGFFRSLRGQQTQIHQVGTGKYRGARCLADRFHHAGRPAKIRSPGVRRGVCAASLCIRGSPLFRKTG